METNHGVFNISTEKGKLQVDFIHWYLTEVAYWTTGRTRDMTEKTIEQSLCFGLYHHDRQIGFARVVTDHAIFAYLCDVFIIDEYQGQGLGKWLIDFVLTQKSAV